MATELELTPLKDEDGEVVHYGLKVHGPHCNGGLAKQDGRPRKKELRFMPTRIVMKRKHKLFRVLMVLFVLLLLFIICVLLGFYLTETQKRKTTETKFVPTHVNMMPILPQSSIFVTKFESYLHLGDSRLFEAIFSNGSSLKAYGIKEHGGDNFRINWLTLTDAKDLKTRVRFGDKNNMAYVLLSNGAQVNYEWSRDLANLDLKVYLSSELKGLDAKSFIFTVKLMEYTSRLQIIFKTLSGKRRVDDFPLNIRKKQCPSYLPLRVTKCGSKNAYAGAFVEGKVTNGGKSRVILPTLPWPSAPDECFQQTSDDTSKSNFYIPLPKRHNDDSMCNTATKYFIKSCSVIPIELPPLDICYNISRQVNDYGDRHFDQLVDIVFQSCVGILTSLILMCSSLQTEYNPYISAHSPFFLLSDTSVRGRLCSSAQTSSSHVTSDMITLNILAFCPSEPPITSPDQVIYLNTTSTVGEKLHVNCRGPPEVSLYQLGHLYVGDENHLTTLKHNFRFCARCAFESVVSVRVLENEVCCKDRCAADNTSVCAVGNLGLSEKYRFNNHGNLYCHNFLQGTKSETPSLDIKCTGDCVNHFTIDFKMANFREQTIFYHQPITCRGSRSQMCNSKFGT